MARFCKHNYAFTQGYFYCTKCGHRNYGRTYRRKKNRKIALAVFGIVIAVGVLFAYTNPSLFSSLAEQSIRDASNQLTELTKSLEEELEKAQTVPQKIEPDNESPPSNPTNVFKPEFDKTKIENLVYDLTNQQRNKNGMPSLSFDSKLSGVARGHSNDILYQKMVKALE